MSTLSDAPRTIPGRLAEIKARADAATAGPWVSHKTNLAGGGREAFVTTYATMEIEIPTLTQKTGFISKKECFGTCDFIAHAREDVPALVAEVERLRAICEQAATCLEHWDRNGAHYLIREANNPERSALK